MTYKDYSTWTALITPLDRDRNVDLEGLTYLVKEQENAGNGLLILGSTGEALNLRLEDKKKIIEHVLSLKPKSSVMVGVGGHQLQETLDWLKYLETLKLDAYLMVTPIYAKPGPVGQYNWFRTLMDSVTRPCMLYNVPGRSAVALSTEAVAKLSTHKNFWSIKEASGSVERFREYLKSAAGKPVFCGDDALMPDFALAGASGLISVASNCWPKETHLYTKMCLNKTFDNKALWTDASNSLFIASNPVPVKTLMHEKGQINTPFMAPPLSHEDLKHIEPLIAADRAVSEWYQRNKQ